MSLTSNQTPPPPQPQNQKKRRQAHFHQQRKDWRGRVDSCLSHRGRREQ